MLAETPRQTQHVLVGLHLPSVLDLLGVLQELEQVAEEGGGDGLGFLTDTAVPQMYSIFTLVIEMQFKNKLCTFADGDLQISVSDHLPQSSDTLFLSLGQADSTNGSSKHP